MADGLPLTRHEISSRQLADEPSGFLCVYMQDLLSMVPQPVLAVIMCYPITKQSEAAAKQGGRQVGGSISRSAPNLE